MPKYTAAKAAPKRSEQMVPQPQPDPPKGIPGAQANLIALAVRLQHLQEMHLGNIRHGVLLLLLFFNCL